MKDLDAEGLFWLADKPDEKVAGHLKTDGKQGAELALIGSFHDRDSAFVESPEPIRIQGLAGNKQLTLDACFLISRSVKIPGVDQEIYRVPIVLDGAYFEMNEELSFNGFHLRLRHLEHWIGRTEITEEHDVSPAGNRRVSISDTEPESIDTHTKHGKLSLYFGHSIQGGQFERKILEFQQFRFDFQKRQSLERILGFCGSLQDLVTMGIDAPTTIMEVCLFHPDIKTKLKSGKFFYYPIRLHMQYRGTDLPDAQMTIHNSYALFTFDDIGGLEGIARWLEYAEKFRPVIGALLAQWYIPQMYADSRFFNAITAAEAFERIWRNPKNLKLLPALQSLTAKAGDTFRILVGDVDHWAKKVTKTRHNNVVHRGFHEDEEPDLYLLSESVYFLVALCLLQECGVPEATLSKMQRHQRFRSLKERIQASP